MTKKIIIAITGCVCIGLLFTGCAKQQGKDVLARVNGQEVTVEDFKNRIQNLPPYYRALAKEQKEKFLEELINEKLLLREALRRKIDTNKEVRELFKQAKNKIIIAKLIELEVSGRSKVTDDEIEEYYWTNKDKFVTAEQYRARHILVSTESEAKEIAQRIGAGEEFAAVAQQVSIDPSRVNGGDLGYFTEGQMIPDFEEACIALDVGEVSGIIKTQFGYHIIKLEDKKPPAVKSLEDVRDNIRHKLQEEQKTEGLKSLIGTLRKRARIRVYEQALKEYAGEKKEDKSDKAGE